MRLNSARDVPAWPVVPAHCSPVPPHWPVAQCAGLEPSHPVRPQTRPLKLEGTVMITDEPGAMAHPPFW